MLFAKHNTERQTETPAGAISNRALLPFFAVLLAFTLGGCTLWQNEPASPAESSAHFQFHEGIELTDDLRHIAEDIGYGEQEGEESPENLESTGTLSEAAYWRLVPALEAEEHLEAKYPKLDFRVTDCYTAWNGQTNTYQQGKTVKLELLEDRGDWTMSSGSYTVTVDWSDDTANPTWCEDYYLDYIADEYNAYVTDLLSSTLSLKGPEAAVWAKAYSPTMVGDDIGPSTKIEQFAKNSVCDIEIYVRGSDDLDEAAYEKRVEEIVDSAEGTGIPMIWSAYCITRLDASDEFTAELGHSAARTGDEDSVDLLQPGHKWYLHGYVGLEDPK